MTLLWSRKGIGRLQAGASTTRPFHFMTEDDNSSSGTYPRLNWHPCPIGYWSLVYSCCPWRRRSLALQCEHVSLHSVFDQPARARGTSRPSCAWEHLFLQNRVASRAGGTQLRANHCRLRHLGWDQRGHELKSRSGTSGDPSVLEEQFSWEGREKRRKRRGDAGACGWNPRGPQWRTNCCGKECPPWPLHISG